MESTQRKINSTIYQLTNLNLMAHHLDSENFFSMQCGLVARELLCIMFSLENQFCINFDIHDINNENFYNLLGLTEIIYTKTNLSL